MKLQDYSLCTFCYDVQMPFQKIRLKPQPKKIEELNSHASLFSLNRWFWNSLKNRVRESLESRRERERLSAASWWCNIIERGVTLKLEFQKQTILLHEDCNQARAGVASIPPLKSTSPCSNSIYKTSIGRRIIWGRDEE